MDGTLLETVYVIILLGCFILYKKLLTRLSHKKARALCYMHLHTYTRPIQTNYC